MAALSTGYGRRRKPYAGEPDDPMATPPAPSAGYAGLRGAPGAGMGFAAAGIPGAIAADAERPELVDPGTGLVVGSEAAETRMKAQHPELSRFQMAPDHVPPNKKPDTTVAEASQTEADPEGRPLAPAGKRLELPEGAGYIKVRSRSEGGSGAGWLAGQAKRQAAGLPMSRQVFGFDAGGIEAAAQREPTQAQEDLEGSARPRIAEGAPWQDKPGMVSIEAGGRTRSAGTPEMQKRWAGEFRRQRAGEYADYDIARAAQDAELARQRAQAEDPFAEIGAETVGRKELIGAETEGQKELIGAEAETRFGIEQRQNLAFGARLEQIQEAVKQALELLREGEEYKAADEETRQNMEANAQSQGQAEVMALLWRSSPEARESAARYMQPPGGDLGY